MIQALTTIANDGMMLKPYIVSKIVNSETGEIILENNRTEVRQVSSKETVEKIKKLMSGVVNGGCRMATGTGYKVKGYDLIGKTGTAQIASSKGGYLIGAKNYVRSFAGMFPEKDPQVIIYAVGGKTSSSKYIKQAVKSLVKDVGTYLNINVKENNTEIKSYKIDSYINKDTSSVVKTLTENNMKVIALGEGKKIINQYPASDTVLNAGNKIILITNDSKIKMPDISGWSRNDVQTLASLIGIEVNFNGYGYVKSYSIKKDTIIEKGTSLDVTLETKYN